MAATLKNLLSAYKAQQRRKLKAEGFLRPKPKRRWTFEELANVLAGKNADGTERDDAPAPSPETKED